MKEEVSRLATKTNLTYMRHTAVSPEVNSNGGERSKDSPTYVELSTTEIERKPIDGNETLYSKKLRDIAEILVTENDVPKPAVCINV